MSMFTKITVNQLSIFIKKKKIIYIIFNPNKMSGEAGQMFCVSVSYIGSLSELGIIFAQI